MLTVREVRAGDVQFMVNPMPLKGSGKTHRCKDGIRRAVYTSCNHIDLRKNSITPHPYSFLFCVVDA